MKCKNCLTKDAIKYSKYSKGDFCSRECARAYSTKEKRKEINKKVSATLKNKTYPKRKLTEKELEIIQQKIRETWDNKILNAEYSTLKFQSLRRRIILEQNNSCSRCNLSEWLSEPLILEIEHKDGNHNNNERSNLEALCPNCHSLTSTWRGRNKQQKKNKINDETLLKSLVKNNFNMRQALLEVGLAAKGGNYVRCHRLKRVYDEMLIEI